MPNVTGNLSTNKLTLQAHGPVDTGNLVMEVADSAFTMSMGSNVLMTVAPDGVDVVNGSYTESLLTLNRSTEIAGNLTVDSNVVISGSATLGGVAIATSSTVAIAVAAEATRATGVEALKAPLADPSFSGTVAVGGTLSLPLHSNVDSALSAVETKMDTIQPLVRDPSLPTFEELERTNTAYYAILTHANDGMTAPDYYSKRISHRDRAVNVRWPERTYGNLDIDYCEEVYKNMFAWSDKFLPKYKLYPTYAYHNIKDRLPFIFDVSGNDASGNVLCVANNNIVIGVEWYQCAFIPDTAQTTWSMLFKFKYSTDTGASENFTGLPTHVCVIVPRKIGTAYANGCIFINYIPLTTNAVTHASNVTSNINSALWYDGVLSISAKIYDNVYHTPAHANILNTTTSNKLTIDFNAVNFYKSPTFNNVYKSYNLTPEVFIQKGNAIIENWAAGQSNTIPSIDSSKNLYDGLIAAPFRLVQDPVIKFSNYHEKFNWYAFMLSNQNIKIPDVPYNATGLPNPYITVWMAPVTSYLNKDGGIDQSTYKRGQISMSIHEYTHMLQTMNRGNYRKDIEAQASYLELQPGINLSGDYLWWYAQYFKTYPKFCVSNTKTFLGTTTSYGYQFYLFYLYMSKYDTVDSEFGRNPRFFAEVMNLLENRTYLSNISDSVGGIGFTFGNVNTPLIDSSGVLTQFEIYNGAYKALKGDSSANILASEYDNIVMASILNISETEAATTYAGSHSNISSWAYPDYINVKAIRYKGVLEMDAAEELKPMIRTIVGNMMKDAPKLSTYSPEYVINKNYSDLVSYANYSEATFSRTNGSTGTEVSNIENIAMTSVYEPYSSMTINALRSSQNIVTSTNILVRSVYFPSENNLTVNDISPVTTLDASMNNVYTYTVNTSSSNALIVIINNTSNSSKISVLGVVPKERLVIASNLFALPDIIYGAATYFNGVVVDTYANINAPIVVLGKPTTNLTDMIGANGMKLGRYSEFFDASGVSYVTGKIVVVARGTLVFPVKVNNAWWAGAAGIIIVDNNATNTSLNINFLNFDTAMNIPAWRIQPSWYHANIAPYLVAGADGRTASTPFDVNWALNYQYGIPLNPVGVPPSEV